MNRLYIASDNVLSIELRDADTNEPIVNAAVSYTIVAARDNAAIAVGTLPHRGNGRYSAVLPSDLALEDGALYLLRLSAVLPQGTAHTQQLTCIARYDHAG